MNKQRGNYNDNKPTQGKAEPDHDAGDAKVLVFSGENLSIWAYNVFQRDAS